LAEALYGGDPPPTWRKVVQGSIGRLRRILGVHAIATLPGGYRLELGDDEIDARRLERLVGEANELAAIGEHERAALTLDAALALVSGEPFADLDGWDPRVAAAARCVELVYHRRCAITGAKIRPTVSTSNGTSTSSSKPPDAMNGQQRYSAEPHVAIDARLVLTRDARKGTIFIDFGDRRRLVPPFWAYFERD
jgi:Bacterial transcriptional activator domain